MLMVRRITNVSLNIGLISPSHSYLHHIKSRLYRPVHVSLFCVARFITNLKRSSSYTCTMAAKREIMMPREAGKFIAANSKDVKISEEGVKKTANLIFDCVKGEDPVIHVDRWQTHQLNPKTKDEQAVNWVFVSDIGNFSFWSDDESHKYKVAYGDKDWTGYWAWCAAMNRAIDEGIKFTDPTYLASLDKDTLAHILRSDSDVKMPMLDERVQVLNEAGKVLVEKYNGTFVNVIKKAEKSAQKLLEIIVQDFPSLRDEAEFNGKKVAIYKRPQILVADIWACCGGEGYGEFTDIDTITMFADYRIPQALVWFGALKYSDELMDVLKKGQLMKNGDRQEVEIRGCTIEAVELIVEETKKMIQADPAVSSKAVVNAIVVDHYLWDYRREHADETADIPIHKTRSIYY